MAGRANSVSMRPKSSPPTTRQRSMVVGGLVEDGWSICLNPKTQGII